MVRRRSRYGVLAIKQRIQDGLALFSEHARIEMEDEDIQEGDVTQAVLKGALVKRQTRGGRGTRYVMRGPTLEGGAIEVVCRLVGENVRIITVYRV
jgi:hypothetical protein